MQFPVGIEQVRESLMRVSRLLYGRQYRLEIAAAIGAMPSPVWSRQVAKVLDIAENQVAREFRDFAELGALHAFPDAHDRRKNYQAVPHPLWESTRELFERTIREEFPDGSEQIIDAYWEGILGSPTPRPIPLGGG